MRTINIARIGFFSWLVCFALSSPQASEVSAPAPVPSVIQPTVIYPSESQRLGEEGTVVLQFVVDKTGQTSSAEVLKSSGFERLDRAAIEAVQKARLGPYTQDGQPAVVTARRAIQFQLSPTKRPSGKWIPYGGFALEFETRIAFAKSSILRFSVMPASETTLTAACFDEIKQWVVMNPGLSPQLTQGIAGLETPTQLDLQRLVARVDEKALAPEDKIAFTDSCVAGMVHSLAQGSYFYRKKDLDLVARYNRDGWGEAWFQAEYENGLVTVKAIPTHAHGYRDGLRVGDRIEMIDGQRLALDDRVQFRRLIRGPTGSRATLSVLRGNAPAPLTISVEREVPVRIAARSERTANDFLYLGASNTDEASLTEIAAALRKASNEVVPVRGVILDLRNNPGDTVPSVVGIAAAFVPPGTFLGEVRRTEHEPVVQLYATPYFYWQGSRPDPLQGLPAWTKQVPLLVLVNHTTGNGAEFIAAALQDSQRAVLIGQRTAGRAMIRSQINDPSGAMLILISGYMYRQGNRLIDGTGVEPDIQVPEVGQQVPQIQLNKDPIVSAAINALVQRTKNSF